MSVKTLNNLQSCAASSPQLKARTYSIEPNPGPSTADPQQAALSEIESFLEAENPMGCIRGVMWVMAFNAAVFLLGFMIWQSCKYL